MTTAQTRNQTRRVSVAAWADSASQTSPNPSLHSAVARQIAEALRDWLPMAIQAVKPYMSDRDNEAGVRWEGKVSAELASSNFGILCLTPDNLQSAWLNFEAGALGKVVDESRAVPLLHRVAPADVARPLGMFMSKPLGEKGIKETLIAINNNLESDRRVEPAALEGAFEAMWPRLEGRLGTLKHEDAPNKPLRRDVRDIAEETLELVRGLSRPYTVSESAGGATRTTWVTPRSYNLRNTPGDTLSRIIGNVFGQDVRYKLVGNRLILAPTSRLLDGHDMLTPYNRMVEKLEELGLEVQLLPDFDPMTTDTSTGASQH
jgi:hypothetical protein